VVTWYILVRVSSERYIAIWADLSCSDVQLTWLVMAHELAR
jgi:hypothetical protein